MNCNPYTKDLKCLVFDIETGGLDPLRSQIISASFVETDGSGMFQLFADSPEDEARVVKTIYDVFSQTDVIIGYNSNRFDIPFVAARLKANGMSGKLPLFWSVDIYKWLKYYWPLAKRLEHLRQKDVEEVFGLSPERDDVIDGGKCIPLYQSWLVRRDCDAKEKILLHNGDDVRQLARITQKLSFLPYHRIAFEGGFLAVCGGKRLKTGKISIDGKKLAVKGKTAPQEMPASIFADGCEFECDVKGNFTLEVFVRRNEKQLFVDLKELPVDTVYFEGLAGYHSGYLVLKDEEGPQYRECCELVRLLTARLLS
ncbi:MAG: ribonuclease H-like domain-containing protein [Firmicutes bacterium]|nr:ribonuclease H-like domain-containing protein [Bacillota bacterium]